MLRSWGPSAGPFLMAVPSSAFPASQMALCANTAWSRVLSPGSAVRPSRLHRTSAARHLCWRLRGGCYGEAGPIGPRGEPGIPGEKGDPGQAATRQNLKPEGVHQSCRTARWGRPSLCAVCSSNSIRRREAEAAIAHPKRALPVLDHLGKARATDPLSDYGRYSRTFARSARGLKGLVT